MRVAGFKQTPSKQDGFVNVVNATDQWLTHVYVLRGEESGGICGQIFAPGRRAALGTDATVFEYACYTLLDFEDEYNALAGVYRAGRNFIREMEYADAEVSTGV